MKAQTANEIYSKNWSKDFTNMTDLYHQIKILSENGAYQMCIYVDSKQDYDKVYGELVDNGYEVDHYNGGNNGIIEISWGIM